MRISRGIPSGHRIPIRPKPIMSIYFSLDHHQPLPGWSPGTSGVNIIPENSKRWNISSRPPPCFHLVTSIVNQQKQFQDSKTALRLPLALELRPPSQIERILKCQNSSASPHLAAEIMRITMMMVMVMMNLVAQIMVMMVIIELAPGGGTPKG